jgi:tetratricopeptide (TPR) repeat protein
MNRSTDKPALISDRKATFAICIGLVVAVFCVFGQVIHHDFISVDDDLYVYKNPHVVRGLTWDGLVWAFTHFHAAFWHPLTSLSLMLDCELYGLRAGGFHVTSVLLHAATAVVLFLALRRMTGLRYAGVPSVVASATQAGAMWPSAFVAGLFALHPLRVESVAWVAERKDVLSGFFFVLTLWAYVKYVSGARCQVSGGEANAKGQRLKAKTLQPSAFSLQPCLWYWLTVSFFALGLMAKSMLVTLPFVLLLLDYWPLRRVPRVRCQESGANPRSTNLTPDTPHRALLLEKLPLFALVLAAVAMTISGQRQVGAFKGAADLSLPWRLANAAVSYVVYIGQMIFPYRLSPYYPHSGTGLSLLAVFGAVLILVVITAAVIYWGRRFAYLPVGWFWYLGMLVPVIGLIQVGAFGHADRYTYLPQIGLYIMVAWGLAEVSIRRPRHKLKLVITGVACLAILMACTWRQTRYWRNSEVLWRRALACSPESSWIEKALADVLSDQGKLDEAIVHYWRGAQIAPNYAGLRLNFGNALYRKSRLTEAQQELEAALQADPELDDAHISLGVVLYLRGNIEPAIQHFESVLARNPSNTAALSDLGVVLESRGRMDEAIVRYRQALRVNPSFTDAHRNLGRALSGRGQATEAILHYEQALKASPNDVNLRSDLAGALAHSGQFEQAVIELQRALALLGPEQQTVAQKLRDRLKDYQAGRLGQANP